MAALGILLLLTSVTLLDAYALPNIRDLKARFHPQTNSIFVEWSFPQPHDNVRFNVRYISNRGDGTYKHMKTSDTMIRLNLPHLSDGDELRVQVSAERGGHVIEDWSQELIITVTKKTGGADSSGGDVLVPPMNFMANILDTKTVRLEWTPVEQPPTENNEELYYIVNVKQLTAKSSGVLQRQQIKTSASLFTMGRLIPGERYELTIRSALSEARVSSTAAIVEITMPKDEEFFEIGNLIISSLFKAGGVGTVNLTWDVPQNMVDRIIGYEVQYAESGTEAWHTIKFNGALSSASLENLKSDTEYLLKIKTLLKNDIFTESGQFNFKTPRVHPNPIRKVDVIYSHEVNSVRLQWMLEPHINPHLVAGYDVFYSENKDAPESHWRHVALTSREAMLSIPNLKSLTTYFVRVNIRQTDGHIIRSPSLYRFTTMDGVANVAEVKEANALSYRNLVPGKVAVSWTFASGVTNHSIGSTIYYSENKELPLESWLSVAVHDARNTSIVLSNLREGSRYFVKIVPRLSDGSLDHANEEEFEMHTDTRERFEEQLRSFHPVARRTHPEHLQHLKVKEDGKTFLRITSCNPDAILDDCALDEVCVSRVGGNGWCIPHSLRDAILQS